VVRGGKQLAFRLHRKLDLVLAAHQRARNRIREKKFKIFFELRKSHLVRSSHVDSPSATEVWCEMKSQILRCCAAVQLRCIEHVLRDDIAKTFVAQIEEEKSRQ
jgi:hypothetical protein